MNPYINKNPLQLLTFFIIIYRCGKIVKFMAMQKIQALTQNGSYLYKCHRSHPGVVCGNNVKQIS